MAGSDATISSASLRTAAQMGSTVLKASLATFFEIAVMPFSLPAEDYHMEANKS